MDSSTHNGSAIPAGTCPSGRPSGQSNNQIIRRAPRTIARPVDATPSTSAERIDAPNGRLQRSPGPRSHLAAAGDSRHPAGSFAPSHQHRTSQSPRPSSLPDALIEAVRSQACIVDLVPASELRRSGSGFLATCPWHQDRRPSLTVNPERNRVHCFVCNRGADPIGWLQDRQGLSFREAVEELARRYAIPLPEQDPEAAARAEAERRERQRLREWRNQQEEQFHQSLLADLQASGPAAKYLQERGISAETATAWRLGLNAQRLMLPIRDGQGRCCGFSGRSLNGEEPKYRNSSGDLLFQKSELLFGLDKAAASIRKSGEALLVEGPLDVIQLHQAGFDNAVAAMGTALSAEQVRLLQRAGVRRLLVALDGDAAGLKATTALIRLLRSSLTTGGLEAFVVDLGPGQDPDALIRSQGAEALRQRLAGAQHWLAWELDQLLKPLEAIPDDWSLLQRIENQARELLQALPSGGALRR